MSYRSSNVRSETQDPYVVVALNQPYEKGKPLLPKEMDQHIQRTTVSNLGGKHPIWNERFALPVPTEMKLLHVAAFDSDLTGETFIGEWKKNV